MSDLYDDARPVRDAAVAEIERLIAGEPVAPDTRAANILAVHLTAVMMAFVARRHDRWGGGRRSRIRASMAWSPRQSDR